MSDAVLYDLRNLIAQMADSMERIADAVERQNALMEQQRTDEPKDDE